MQLLRSVAQWSLGIDREESIYTAYLHAIQAAAHFVYIENQFFISANAKHGIRNKIADAIIARVSAAILARLVCLLFPGLLQACMQPRAR